MLNFAAKLEIATNIAILIMISLVAGSFAKHYFFPSHSQPKQYAELLGATLRIPNANWGKSERTIVLALNTYCHFCEQSVPFYQRLAKFALNKKVRLIAVLPQSETEVKSFFARNEIPIADFRELPLNQIAVYSTPTVILVDSQGIVLSVWAGKLTPQEETAVINSID